MNSRGENFCALPFHHVLVHTNGVYNICCIHQPPENALTNINSHDHDHWLRSDYVQRVRQDFLDNKKNPGCTTCWKKEAQGFDSLRTRSTKEFAILPDRVDRPIKTIEIDLGNLCNLRCLMCQESNSSAILAENIKLGINKINWADITWGDSAYQNLEKLLDQEPYILNIRGGEPLYNKKLFEMIQDIPATRARAMMLHITTNATVWNEQWQQVLGKFRLVRFMFSLDGTNDVYQYIRYPASWQLVEQNVTAMASLPNAKCVVHCVAQNLNISDLAPLISWCKTHALYLEIESLQFPPYLQIQNLPSPQKEISIEHLNQLLSQTIEPHLEKFVRSAKDLLEQSDFDPLLWQAFVDNISMRDNIRGNNFRNFIKDTPC